MALLNAQKEDDEEPFPWDLEVYDAHCHPTDTMASTDRIPTMKAKVLTIMATRAQDQHLIAETADRAGLHDTCNNPLASQWSKETRVVPCFGWHPWFSHQLIDLSEHVGIDKLDENQKIHHYESVLSPKPQSSRENTEFLLALPDPIPLSQFISSTRKYLEKYPLALIGEVGIDKSFRLPEAAPTQISQVRQDVLTPGGREGRHLTPYRVSMDHQRKILTAQLALAGEFKRAASIHGVQAHGVLFETLKETWKGFEVHKPSKRERRMQQDAAHTVDEAPSSPKNERQLPFPPRLCLHSYSGPAEPLKQYLHPSVPIEVFFSFSTLVNFSKATASKTEEVVASLPVDRLLVESDLHTAGEPMDEYLEDVTRKVCRIKKWTLEEGVKQLGKNWKRFVFGDLDVDGRLGQ
jgi:Tat protein secretion system quality control protein TatD with DNase activity